MPYEDNFDDENIDALDQEKQDVGAPPAEETKQEAAAEGSTEAKNL